MRKVGGAVMELENQTWCWNLIDRIVQFIRQPSRRRWRQKKKERELKHTGGPRDPSIESLATRSALFGQIQSAGGFDRSNAASFDGEYHAAVGWANV